MIIKLRKVHFIVIAIILLTLIFLITFSYKKQLREIESLKVTSLETYPEIYDVLNSITIDKYKQMLENKESFNVYIGRPTCSSCTNFEPQLIEMLSENVKENIYYMNVAKIREDERSWEDFKDYYSVNSTPTFIAYKDGEIDKTVFWTKEHGISLTQVKEFLNYISILQ